MSRKNVLLLSGEGLTHYRVGLFNLLNEAHSLTIAHTGNIIEGADFKQITVVSKKIGPFIYLKQLPNLSNFDVIIYSFNLRMLNIYRLLFAKKENRILVFGLGVSASYTNRYDVKKKLDFIRRQIIKKSDGAIFYEHYPLVKYQSFKINPNKLHVAYNTVLPPKKFEFSERSYESFIFIGTLYKQKKIDNLLEAYSKLFDRLESKTPKLEIVGDGEEFDNIKSWILEKKLSHKIILHGKLTSESDLAPIFRRALVCVSPGQAGLSVQKCFSYGTPFLTTKGAITGGEMFCIIDGVNGFFYEDSIEELLKIMFSIATKTHNIKEISKNAYSFYHNFRTPQIWVEAFKKAIN